MNILTKQFKDVKLNQLVRINDVDLLIELDDTKQNPDFLIKEKREYIQDASNYIVLTLDHVGTDLEYILVCSIFEDACDVKLYKQPEFFKPDKRSVLMESDNGWLFDFEKYPQEIYNGDITFSKKFQNEVFGDSCIVEWVTNSKIVDYELLLIETGNKHDGGGWIEFYEGRMIRDTDVVF
jgi:hypothetical protein